MPVIAGARCAPPAGGQGGQLHRARVNDHCVRRRRAPPPFPPCGGAGGGDCIVRASTITARGAGARPPLSPPAGGQGGARADHGQASQRPRSSASAGFADRRRPTAHGGGALGIMRQGAPVRCAEPAEARTMQSPPPFPPPHAGGKGGGRSAWLRCGASSVMKVMEGATKARSSSLTSLG